MDARSESLESRYLASVYNDPFLSDKKRGELLGVTQRNVQCMRERLKERGIDVQKELRRKIVGEKAKEMPDATVGEIAEAVGAEVNVVNRVLKAIESKTQNMNRLVAYQKRKNRERTELAIEACRAESFQDSTRSGIIKEIADALRENPFKTHKEIACQFHKSCDAIAAVERNLNNSGFNRELERQILTEEFFEANPGATVEDAALYFNTKPYRIKNGKRLERRYAAKSDAAKNTEDNNCEWDCNLEIDGFMESRLFLRPAWYVEEVYPNGYLGISLPENEFKAYLDLYNKKKAAKIPDSPQIRYERKLARARDGYRAKKTAR